MKLKLTQNQYAGFLEYLPKTMAEGSVFFDTENIDIYVYNSSLLPSKLEVGGALPSTFSALDTLIADKSLVNFEDGGLFSSAISAPAEAYSASWSASPELATKGDLYTKIESITGAAGIGGSIADDQIAYGNGANIEGNAEFKWDGTQMLIQGLSSNRYVRFFESTGFYNGAYLQYEGSTNKFHMGVHIAGDALEASDIKVFTMQRADGFIGINKEAPAYEFDVVGTVQASVDFRSPGVRIAPTFADFEGRIATGGVSGFGGSRLGNSDIQSDSYDVGTTVNFVTTAQQTQWAWFSNVSGNTMTMRHVENPTALLSIQNNAADVVLDTNDVESTLGLVTQYSTGDPHVYDLFNQHYVADGSVIAQAQGVNMIAPVANHRPYVIARSETGLTNITTMLEIDGASLTTQVATWGIPNVFESIALSALNTAPSSASDTGTLGEIRFDDTYMYLCTATDTWKRSELTTWV